MEIVTAAANSSVMAWRNEERRAKRRRLYELRLNGTLAPKRPNGQIDCAELLLPILGLANATRRPCVI